MKPKTIKIVYWVTTSIIFLFDCVIPAFTSNSELAKQALAHLRYPDYFGPMLTVFKVIGGFLLILPQVAPRFKEWAYFGFGLSMACASVSYMAVDGMVFFAFFPWIFIAILAVSYSCWHKMLKLRTAKTNN